MNKKKRPPFWKAPFILRVIELLLHLIHDGLKGFGIVHSEVGQDFAVDLDIVFFQFSHENRVRHPVFPYACVDTLDPQGAVIAFLVLRPTYAYDRLFS